MLDTKCIRIKFSVEESKAYKMHLSKFYSKYPPIHQSKTDLFNTYGSADFNDLIVSKKEFADLKLEHSEPPIGKKGESFRYQEYITRYVSALTEYSELLVYHEMGTGKTCTAVHVIEKLRADPTSGIKGAIIFAKGTGILNNFVSELLFKCTDGRYIPDNYEQLTDHERAHRVRKITSEFYDFNTFETFAKALHAMSDKQIRTHFDNRILVLDEVHNIREKQTSYGSCLIEPSDDGDKPEEFIAEIPIIAEKVAEQHIVCAATGSPIKPEEHVDVYKQFHRLCHVLTHRKILLLSGTPMSDGPEEFGSIMNLILPASLQLPTGKKFIDRYFTGRELNQNFINELEMKIRGRISYIKASTTNVPKVFIGEKVGKLQHFIVDPLYMSTFQSEAYVRAYSKDSHEKVIFTNSRQASLFVYPDGSFGADGFNQERYIVKTKRGRTGRQEFRLGDALSTAIGNVNIDGVETCLVRLKQLSVKYFDVIRLILSDKTSKSFVYCPYVKGSGLIVLGLILSIFGYSRIGSSRPTKKGMRYALISNQVATEKEIKQTLESFNLPENVRGDYISVIIGSKAITEGYTLKDVQNSFILSPHWNYSETSQAIARSWRIDAHKELKKQSIGSDVTLNVYQYVALPDKSVSTDTPVIDLDMYYKSETKDVLMKKIEHLVKKTSFDCPLAKDRNEVTTLFSDGSRECDYGKCDYECSGNISYPFDRVSYDLFYTKSDKIRLFLRDYFRKKFQIKLSDLTDYFGDTVDKFEAVQIITRFVNESITFSNKFGRPNFLSIDNDTLYLSAFPGGIDNSSVNLSKYYCENIILENGDVYSHLLDEIYDTNLPTKIRTLFDNPRFARSIIGQLPYIIQRTILEGCILSKIKNKTKYEQVREDILDLFKGFYFKRSSTWVITLYNDELDCNRCLEVGKDDVWTDCDDIELLHADKTQTGSERGGLTKAIQSPETDEYEDQTVARKNLPAGPQKQALNYRGLFNPQMDAFCIRDLTTIDPSEKDLRKIKVGRKCIDWEYGKLIDLLVRKLKVYAPASFRENDTLPALNTDLDKLGRKDKAGKEPLVKPDDYLSVDKARNILYWTSKTRADICDEIKDWFETYGLLEENFDCGHQKKKRAKFATNV